MKEESADPFNVGAGTRVLKIGRAFTPLSGLGESARVDMKAAVLRIFVGPERINSMSIRFNRGKTDLAYE